LKPLLPRALPASFARSVSRFDRVAPRVSIHFQYLAVKVLSLSEIEWLRNRVTDQVGRLFRWEGGVYRAIYPEQARHVQQLFDGSIVTEMVESGLLIGTELTELRLEGFGLVLKHRTLPFATKPFEWPRQFLRDAALVVLDLNRALLPHGLGTVDAHGGNIGAIDAGRPVWVDFGSIVPTSSAPLPLEEFRRFFRRPLQLLERAPSSSAAVRQIIRAGGLEKNAMAELLHPRWNPARWVPRIRGELERRVPWIRSASAVATAERARLLARERARIERLRLATDSTTWGAYQQRELPLYPSNYEDLEDDPRRGAIFQILREARPRRVLDLAANAGFFSFFAARQGAQVLAVDFDEPAIGCCYETARAFGRDISITCVVADVMEPPPVARNGDFALALALTHHLALGQRYTFAAIAESLARFTTQTLLVEFMPNGLGGTRPLPDPLPDWYRLDSFLRELETHFENVAVVDYPYDPARNRRVLIHARNCRRNEMA